MDILKLILVSSLMLLVNNYASADFPDKLKQRYAPAIIQPHHININAPIIAEEPEFVPIQISSIQKPVIDSTVTEISFYLNHKLNTPVATYKFNATTLAEDLKFRMRMRGGENTLYTIARLSDGSVVGGTKTIRAVYRYYEF